MALGRWISHIIARFAIGDEDRNQHPGNNPHNRQEHGLGRHIGRHGKVIGCANVVDIGHQDFIKVNRAKTGRQQQIGKADRAGENAGNGAAVNPQAIEYRQKRRDHHRNKGDVNRHQVLRNQRTENKDRKQEPFKAL